MSKTISITLTFDESDLNEMLEYGNMSDDDVTVDDLTDEQFNELAQLLKDTASNFVEEIVNNTETEYEWLADYMGQFED
jgi:ABC-type proline/glycine betaine transport system ATPase subunit